MLDNKNRCEWVTELEIDIDYHDNEWGQEQHNDNKLFEMICLEAFQAGLSWLTILKKRKDFRLAFDNFDPEKVANYDNNKVEELLSNEKIIRHRGKILAAINNAKLFLDLQKKYGSFDKFIWDFVDYQPILNKYKDNSERPSKTELSDKISKTLKKLGFKFMGSTIVYSFMQATGMVNDHTSQCFLYKR